ncbi:MAG: thymidine phosphorylase [Bdellovibrionales bacterium]|nr:thymidine phosphorylase [Bdellovibrionales bacterium]
MRFNPVSLVKKKRGGGELSREEIAELVSGYTDGSVPDYQMSAFLMAVLFRGMTSRETADLVDVMQHSGKVANLSRIQAPKLDKHSTGGIGDKTSLILAPLLASCGVAYPTIAGKGLGHTGGTVDKLLSIPGFNAALTLDRFAELVGSVGCAFIGQTEEICPADRKIYALRDVTGTVESIPLIVASIMSKKLAEGIDGLVLDVKVGSGAFMKTLEDAEALARALVDTGKAAGKLTRAVLTDMSQPLGRAVGNAIEVNECVAFLRHGHNDPKPEARLWEVTMTLAEELLAMGEEKKSGRQGNRADARRRLEEALTSGRAYSKFLEIVSLQGGDTHAVDEGLPLAPKKSLLKAGADGFVSAMRGEEIGMALIELGGGRKATTDQLDYGVGFEFHVRLGEKVRKGDALVSLFHRDSKSGDKAMKILEDSVLITPDAPRIPDLIHKRI